MATPSGHIFPIFISSRDYSLTDLKAELAEYLTKEGYKPILSSGVGFPDSSPDMEPWESCLPVLDTCLLMILIIDGEYGSGLNWTHYGELFEDKKLSPTHGEYIYAHKTGKRMLVFIRSSLMPFYQSFRIAINRTANNKDEAKKIISLPNYVSFETLEFINEVKTTTPIPWITEFRDITDIKKEIHAKMFNELAELYMIKNKRYETVVDSFNKVMDSLPIEEQKKTLQKINATKEIIAAVEKLDEYKKELNKTRKELESIQESNSSDKKKYTEKIDSLNKKIHELEAESIKFSNSEFYIEDGRLQLKKHDYLTSLGGALYNKKSFLKDVKDLIESNLFPDQKVTAWHKNVTTKGFVFDYVLESKERTYLVVIPAHDNHYQARVTAISLRNLMKQISHNDLPMVNSNSNPLQPIIIMPSIIRFLGKQKSGIPILKYIIDSKTFKNWDDIHELLDEQH